MILFKLLLIILLAAPVVYIACRLFIKARDYSVTLNRKDRAMEREREKRRNGYY